MNTWWNKKKIAKKMLVIILLLCISICMAQHNQHVLWFFSRFLLWKLIFMNRLFFVRNTWTLRIFYYSLLFQKCVFFLLFFICIFRLCFHKLLNYHNYFLSVWINHNGKFDHFLHSCSKFAVFFRLILFFYFSQIASNSIDYIICFKNSI